MRIIRGRPSQPYGTLSTKDPIHEGGHCVGVHIIHDNPSAGAQTICYVYEPYPASRTLRYLGRVAIFVGLQPKPHPMLGFRKNQPPPRIYVSSVVTVSPTIDPPSKYVRDDEEPLGEAPLVWRFYKDVYSEWMVEREGFDSAKT